MTTITREQALKIIEAADEVISALAGTNEDVHPGSDNMLRLWDDLNDRYAPPEVVRELARIALASLEADPVKRVNSDQMRRVCLEANRHLDKYDAMAKEVNKLLGRIAPPAPVVPEEATPENVEMLSGYVSTYKLTDSERDIAAEIWNACREAMLQSGNFRENKDSSTNNFRKIPEASTSSPVTPALLPGGFTIEEAKELHEDLVRSHISKALSGEKMKKKDRDADLRWIHGVIVQAAWFVKASLEQNALSGNYPDIPDSSVPAPGKGVTGERIRIKPHVYRELVNRLHDTAIKCAGTQQLRERISRVLGDVITPDHHKQAEKSGLERCHLEAALNIKPGHTLGIIDALLVHKMARALLPLVAEKHEADHANES